MQIKTYEMILVSLFAALTAVGAFIKIPTPIVPFTLQFLFSAYAGVFLGARLGLYSQLLYIGIGLAGIPIFTRGGGITYIFQPTFGFILGFAFCAFIIGKMINNTEEIKFARILFVVLIGLLVVYVIGVPYLYLIIKFYLGKSITFLQAISVGFTPYIIPDIFKSILVAYTAVKVIPVLRKSGYINGETFYNGKLY
jgi:biotin transport system substrate-specific component